MIETQSSPPEAAPTTLWRRARVVFDQLAPLDGTTRRRQLDALVGDDPQLHRAVDRLLDHDRSDDFLDIPWSPPAPPSADPWIGARLGPYRVTRELGRGGSSLVFLAERDDAEFEHRVAVKVLTHAYGERTHERFRQERQILARLVHPNITRLIGGGTTPDGFLYGLMDLVDGLPITTYCDQHRVSIEERLTLFCKVCDAVQHAHRNLIVHRDLKPSNILVTPDGEPQLLDFGIAKDLDTPRNEADEPTRWMTPAYASPEQLLGRRITTSTDVYSLGVLLFELLCGRRPYDSDRSELLAGTTRPAPSRAWQTSDLPPSDAIEAATRRRLAPARLRQRLRGDLDHIVGRALRDDPEARWTSVEQMAADIRRHLAGQPIEARRGNLVYRWRKFVLRHRVAVAVAATLSWMVLSFAALAVWQADQRAEERDLAQREKIKAETVSEAMVDLFRLLDPRGGREYSEAGKALLDTGSRRIERDFADQPEIQATLRNALGSIYFRLGFFPEAERHFGRALEQRRQMFGPDHPEVAETLGSFGALRSAQGQLDEAETMLRRAVAILGRDPTDSRAAAGDLKTLGEVVGKKGDHEAAQELFHDAVAMYRRLDIADSSAMAAALNGLGLLFRDQGETDAAEDAYRQALAIYRSREGDTSLDVGTVLNNLAGLAFRRGDLEASADGFTESLAISRRLRGDDHPEVQVIVSNLAVVRHMAGQLEAAEPLYRESLEHRRQRLGDEHPDVATGLNNLGALLRDLERYDEAEEILHEALAMRHRLLGRDHPHVTACQHLLGQIALATGRPDLAHRYFTQAVAINRASRGDGHTQTGVGLGNLAKWALAVDRPAEALEHVEAAEAIFAESLADGHWRHAEMQTLRGDALARLGRVDEGRALLEQGIASMREQRGDGSLLTREAIGRLDRLDDSD